MSLGSLLKKATNLNADKLVLRDGQPIVFEIGGQKTPKGKPLDAKQLLRVIRGALPAEVQTKLAWGAKIEHTLQSEGVQWTMKLVLSPDKHVQAVLSRAETSQPASNTSDAKPQTLEALSPDHPEVVALCRAEGAALLCCTNPHSRNAAKDLCETLGLHVQESTNRGAILGAVRYTRFGLMIIESHDPRSDPLLRALGPLPMFQRRQQFIAVLVESAKQQSHLHAYALSVNLIAPISPGETLCERILTAYQNWQRNVERFHKCLADVGRL